MWSTGVGSDVTKRIAAPMVGGLVSSFLLQLTVHPAVFAIWTEGGSDEEVARALGSIRRSGPLNASPGRTPSWVVAALVVLAVVLLAPLAWMTLGMLFGGGMMASGMGGRMMGMPALGAIGLLVALLVVVVLVLALTRARGGRRRD